MFGKCKACASHEQHIKSLQAEVEVLRRFAFPAPVAASAEQREASLVLSGEVERPGEISEALARDIREAEFILGGSSSDPSEGF